MSNKDNNKKEIVMMHMKSPPSEKYENIYFIQNHCQTNISKLNGDVERILFNIHEIHYSTLYTCYYNTTKTFYIICTVVSVSNI